LKIRNIQRKLYSFIYRIVILWVSVGLIGCKQNSADDDPVLVKVYDYNFYKSDLVEKMPSYYTEADSARLASQIVNNWIRDKSLLWMADQNLPEEQKDVEKQLEEYRNSLIVYAYERALIGQKLDTLIPEDEMQRYYSENIQNFKLRSYIIKLRYVRLNKEAPRQDKLENWFLSDKESDFEKLYDYCRKYAENYILEENSWLYLEDILKEIPIPTNDLDAFLKQNKHYIFESGNYKYYVRFFDYRLKDDTAPLALERKRVKDLIINKRKAELILKMREDVVKDAYADNKIQLYTP